MFFFDISSFNKRKINYINICEFFVMIIIINVTIIIMIITILIRGLCVCVFGLCGWGVRFVCVVCVVCGV